MLKLKNGALKYVMELDLYPLSLKIQDVMNSSEQVLTAKLSLKIL